MTAHQTHHNSPDPLSDAAAQLAARYNPGPLLMLDSTNVVRFANPAALDALHMIMSDIVGKPFVDLLDPGSRVKGLALLQEAQRGPTVVYELNLAAANGPVVMIGLRGVPLPPEDGQTNGQTSILLTGQLLSPTVATTERLIGLNRRLNALYTLAASASRSLLLTDLLREALAVALGELDLRAGAVFLTSRPVELATVDAATSVTTGSSTDLLLMAQQGFTEAFAARQSNPQRRAAIFTSVANDTPIVQTGTWDELHVQRDDLPPSVGPLLSTAAVPLRNEQQLLGWLYVLTDRYRAFNADKLDTLRTIGNLLGPPVENAQLYGALLEASGQLHAVLDGIDSGVLLVDSAGVVRYANMRLGTLLETEVAAWPGHPRDALLTPQLAPVDQAASIFGGELWAFAGSPRRVLHRFVAPVADQHGAPLGMIEVYNDVTAVLETNRLKDDFIASAAHDLKTPVTAVKGYAQISLRLARRLNEPKLAQQLELLAARTDDLTFMMESLLDLSRLQVGRLQLDINTFPLADLLGRVTRHYDSAHQRKARAITQDVPLEPGVVAWDRARIERVLFNLVDNALKYSPEGGDVRITVRRIHPSGGELVELAITDHGIGIPPAERERIFERFYRVPQTVTDGFSGTGLGLYICQQIIAAHGGTIKAEDARHGEQGTTVVVLLPPVAVMQ